MEKDFINMILIETIKEKPDTFDNRRNGKLVYGEGLVNRLWKQSLNGGSKPVINRKTVALTHFLTSLFSKYFSYLLLSEVINISPGNLDSSLCFFQSSVSHDVLCI